MVRAARRGGHVIRALVTIAAVLGVLAASKPLPVVDWERTPTYVRPESDGAYSPYLNPFFTSPKTLAQTTNWLRLTIERNGDLPSRRPGDDGHWTGNLRFAGCTMQWVERRIEEGGAYIEERANTMKLADFDANSGRVQVQQGMIRADLASETAVQYIRRFYIVEGGRQTPKGEPDVSSEAQFALYLQPDHDLPRRVGQSLVHAGRLCGGPPPH